MSIADELARARRLVFASDESAAKDLLLALVPDIERAQRDDLLMEVFAQLGEIYLVRGAPDTAAECIRRIHDPLNSYAAVLSGTMPRTGVTLSDNDISDLMARYSHRARYLEAGLATARGDHDGARERLAALAGGTGIETAALADDDELLVISAQIRTATALCDDDLHVESAPLWDEIVPAIEQLERRGWTGDEYADHLFVTGATAFGRFCVETGRLTEAQPWLRRAGARADARGWELATARTALERAVACWTMGDHVSTEQLVTDAYPVIARFARAHDVARCWLYLGLVRLASGALEQADDCWAHAERQWRELGRPLPIHRILLQRSWIAIFRSRFDAAVQLVAEAREFLDAFGRRNWLQYARLDDHLGTVWRADALADLGFDGAGDPDETWEEAEARQAESLGVTRAVTDSPEFLRAMKKLEQAADLKVPAALAVDSVRYTITDADARSRWAAYVSAPILAGAFAVAWEWENTALTSELIEYHSARGTFSHDLAPPQASAWSGSAAALVPVDDQDVLADAAGGSPVHSGDSLIRLGPLPALVMDPTDADRPPILSRYRALAAQRYGRAVTTDEPPWSTWP